MYDFLYSEDWWNMVVSEAIIIAVITTIGTIIVALITGTIAHNFTQKSIMAKLDESNSRQKDLSKDHGNLSKDHGDLSKDHGNLSKDHGNLSKDHEMILQCSKKTQESIECLNIAFVEERAKEQMRYENLSEKQKDMISAADSIKAMGEEIKRLSFELAEERKEKRQLLEENMELKNTIKEFQRKPLTRSDFSRGM